MAKPESLVNTMEEPDQIKREDEAMLNEMNVVDLISGVRVMSGKPAKTPEEVPAPQKQPEIKPAAPPEINPDSAPAPPPPEVVPETAPEISPSTNPELSRQIRDSNEQVNFVNGGD